MDKFAKFVDKDTGKVYDTPPKGSKVVKYTNGMAFPDWSSMSPEPDKATNYALGAGSGVLAYAIAKGLLGDDDDKGNKSSVWMRLLRTLAPIGVGGIGAYAGYKLGDLMDKHAQANGGPTLYNQEEAAREVAEGTPREFDMWSQYGLGAASTGYGAYNGKKLFDIWDAKKQLPVLNGRMRALKAYSGSMEAAAQKNIVDLYKATHAKSIMPTKWFKFKTKLGLGLGIPWLVSAELLRRRRAAASDQQKRLTLPAQ